jgi:hypothetical protein
LRELKGNEGGQLPATRSRLIPSNVFIAPLQE